MGEAYVQLWTNRGLVSDYLSFTFMCFRTVTKAMFLTEFNEAWFATVANIAIHPEYNQDTLSTIGLVELEYEEDKYYYKGNYPKVILIFIIIIVILTARCAH